MDKINKLEEKIFNLKKELHEWQEFCQSTNARNYEIRMRAKKVLDEYISGHLSKNEAKEKIKNI